MVVGWLSAKESDFVDGDGKAAPLFRVRYEAGDLAGDEEDLEEHEVLESESEEDDDDEEGEEGGDDAVEGESSVGARSVLEDLEAEATLRGSLREEQELEALAEASARLCEVADQARRQLESRRRSTLPVSQRQASGVSFKSGASALSVNSQRSNRTSTASAESK